MKNSLILAKVTHFNREKGIGFATHNSYGREIAYFLSIKRCRKFVAGVTEPKFGFGLDEFPMVGDEVLLEPGKLTEEARLQGFTSIPAKEWGFSEDYTRAEEEICCRPVYVVFGNNFFKGVPTSQGEEVARGTKEALRMQYPLDVGNDPLGPEYKPGLGVTRKNYWSVFGQDGSLWECSDPRPEPKREEVFPVATLAQRQGREMVAIA